MKAAIAIALTLALVRGARAATRRCAAQSSSSSSPLVKDISLFRDGAGRVAWSAQGDWLAFDRRDPEHGNYQLWVMKRDGTFERCLTCEPLDLRRENCINPTWHPSGDWIVFQLQSQAKRLGFGPVELATGDRGLWSELEVIRRDGRGFWQLTRVHENGGTVLDPQFSFEGDQILWSERVRSRVGRWGEWALRVAQFRGGAVPRLAKPRTFEPGEQHLYLSGSSFTPDDRGALIAGNLDAGSARERHGRLSPGVRGRRGRATHPHPARMGRARDLHRQGRSHPVGVGERDHRCATSGASPRCRSTCCATCG